jgi:hypothetical protein
MRTRPRPGTVAVKASVRTVMPYCCSWSRNQRAALVAPGVPGTRLGAAEARSAASPAAASLSKAGGRFVGACSAAGRATLNASSRSGRPTSSHVPR